MVVGRWLTGWLLVGSLVLAGCAGSSPDPAEGDDAVDASATEDGEASAEDELQNQEESMSLVRMEVTGDETFTWEGEREVLVTRVGGPDLDVNLYSAGFQAPQQLEDPQNRFRWAFDLLNAYDGPGTYEIESTPGGITSTAFLIYMRVVADKAAEEAVFEWEDVELYKEYRELVQPCALVVEDDAVSGSLTCPELATEDGETVAMSVSWTATGS